ncbi:preprotein translocase subunit SecA [Anaplasmataceae bacterium AB001_6]|nr:preprotein translocase subunit SecA [Anaplasmataceae bacterium AB001_6]
MFLPFFKNLLSGTNDKKILKRFSGILSKVNELEATLLDKDIEEFAKNTDKLKDQLANGENLDGLLPEAFAAVREVSKRLLNMRHYDCQILGGIALHKGFISEMKTGEGKTLVAVLAAYLNALTGKGVHIVTVNDYLAKRDAEWMGQIFSALGLTVGCITNDIKPEERKKNYACDIVYATNNELGFDYLKDNMVNSNKGRVQRGHFYAIIDEVDSILIDEARTPLIISGPSEKNVTVYNRVDKIVKYISKDNFILNEKNRTVSLTEEGMDVVEDVLRSHGLLKKEDSLYDFDNLGLIHHVDQALKAHHLFARNKDYIIADDQVVIIDEFTGRMMKGRRFAEGLHQALEAKEGVTVQRENQTLASITFQNYFRMYGKLAGMTGTAKTEEKEFNNIYGLRVLLIPTNLPIQRTDMDDEIYCTSEEKFDAVINLVEECHNNRKQPVLVGVTSIKQSERLSKMMKKHHLPHNVLNAKNHAQEAAIIAKAGELGSITIATNMAGRGTDIKLGGVMKEISEKDYLKKKNAVIKSGGLYIIGTERHESRRIDNQLRGRSGRQGDPGKSKFFLSLEDDLLRIFGSEKIKFMLSKLGLNKGDVIMHPMITKSIERAQKKVEGHNYDIRKNLLNYDDVINSQRQVIFSQRNKILDMTEYDLSPMVQEINQSLINRAFNNENIEYDDNVAATGTQRLVVKSLIRAIHAVYSNNLDMEDEKNLIPERTLGILNDKSQKFVYEKIETIAPEDRLGVIRQIFLLSLDELWRNHISYTDNVRMGIGMRSVGQQNPLVEFKKETFIALEKLFFDWKEMVIMRVVRVQNILDSAEKFKMSFQIKHKSKTEEVANSGVKMLDKKKGKV